MILVFLIALRHEDIDTERNNVRPFALTLVRIRQLRGRHPVVVERPPERPGSFLQRIYPKLPWYVWTQGPAFFQSTFRRS